ncbi:Glucan 1,3-beta-glucosidase I/II [Schizosaccharomyces pombe]|uniref:Glucan endo-1,6-beta-glucosidase exg1 n=1 Tax=Schizosaccharomyces pombe (strain 972 / ATCC 24843) TaxID=284812 RepID=EXG1_SCHPO|nr:glucan 1,6-beta-glucosidase Exg1 [Schizosaccharomyces pombe]Q9URU6.1 RecName: Full=Glucan 1,3-beta-glucosidase 1; AltName: Full=Exo-1,3-beta-glucanase; Flags: Precursor [Schizosaccharomyces pombe 972h-]CAB50968.1 glucan 1,6-beta-glucosidase Exg1 [Schizosaccharomyces pombe]|eukprot:NP_596461.1 glucan 1,6-beta-glucosidase Exg1 [Schizosaccharomyces pombe]
MLSFTSVFSFFLHALLLKTAFSYVIKRNNPVFDYTSEKVRGVNIGGWLVLENWITPQLFTQFSSMSNPPTDEWGFCEVLGADEAASQLAAHYSSFYTESDFATIASWGVNVLRIPIGYWAFNVVDGEPYVQGQEYWLDQALTWAEQYGLKVWIDLHGVPGSQNGFENSGKTGSIGWQQNDTVTRTLDIITYVANKYTQSQYASVVIGIETVNEPLGYGLDMDQLKQYDLDAYNIVNPLSSSVATIIHDAYVDLSIWDYGVVSPSSYNLVMDVHRYQLYESDECSKTLDDHLSDVCSIGDSIASSPYITVTGEWSGTLADCTIFEEGVDSSTFIGPNSGDISTWTDEYKGAVRLFIETQLDQFERGAGWIYWTAKTGGPSPTWDMGLLIEYGVFPQPFTDRQYSSYCG